MYRVLQALNNNVALVKDEHNQQFVVMGLGITFQKRKGDLIIEEKIEKVFSLKSTESRENFMTLLKDVPLDFITVTYDVIETLSDKYDYPFQEYLYVTLTDHIHCAYRAVLDDNYQESKLPNISQEYSIEYVMAKEALAMFRQKILDDFPDDEIGRIALHFINAKGVTAVEKTPKVKLTRSVLKKVQEELERLGIRRTRENSNFYDRLMIHLTYFLQYLDRSPNENAPLMDMGKHIQIAYPEAYDIGSKIYEMIASEAGVEIYESEKFYIVLHIQRLL
ncbi:PRD domain-containing protein [Streptococcus merionis]|uniref:Beta-glucoside bgl operon antiterminator, BglG family n=1 Tax=Streptococcus merionis TaxID=400065 RepID=A0A239SL87_9STRE|nr:PRD domain-containing protein [Streptococcus merionis]SNU86171.1 Beta-glucoside bgl operon antiterminator, BglG family [Streptococcus merionis]